MQMAEFSEKAVDTSHRPPQSLCLDSRQQHVRPSIPHLGQLVPRETTIQDPSRVPTILPFTWNTPVEDVLRLPCPCLLHYLSPLSIPHPGYLLGLQPHSWKCLPTCELRVVDLKAERSLMDIGCQRRMEG